MSFLRKIFIPLLFSIALVGVFFVKLDGGALVIGGEHTYATDES